jgi:hypothetical protein
MYEEGFNEYLIVVELNISNNITYVPGVTTTTGDTFAYGKAANFNGNGYIKTELPGYYDRNHDYAISFFIYANNTGSSNN